MKKKLYFIVLSSILLLTSGCMFIPSIKGNRDVATHTIDISNYDKIEFYANSATLNYSQQQEAAPSLTITVDQNIFDLFDFKTESETLIISLKDKNITKRIRPTEFTITTNSSELKEVSMAGKGEFNVKGKLISTGKVKMDVAGKGEINMNDSALINKLEFNLAGNSRVNALALNIRQLDGNIAGKGTMNLAGKGEKAEISIAGNGNVKALDFEVSEISCNIAGIGRLKTWVHNRLNVSIAGIGNIHYKGNPSVQVEKAGIGHVKKTN